MTPRRYRSSVRVPLDGTISDANEPIKVYVDQPIVGKTEKECVLNALRFLRNSIGHDVQCSTCGAIIPIDAGEIDCPNGCIAENDE